MSSLWIGPVASHGAHDPDITKNKTKNRKTTSKPKFTSRPSASSNNKIIKCIKYGSFLNPGILTYPLPLPPFAEPRLSFWGSFWTWPYFLLRLHHYHSSKYLLSSFISDNLFCISGMFLFHFDEVLSVDDPWEVKINERFTYSDPCLWCTLVVKW